MFELTEYIGIIAFAMSGFYGTVSLFVGVVMYLFSMFDVIEFYSLLALFIVGGSATHSGVLVKNWLYHLFKIKRVKYTHIL